MKRHVIFTILFLLIVTARMAGQAPTITIAESVQKVCFTGAVQTSSVIYAATTGTPDSYSIDWTDMTDQASTSFTFSPGGGTINNIVIPADAAAGTHIGTLTVTNGAGSGTANISVTVNALPIPSITVTETSGTSNDGIVCIGSGVTLTGGGGTSYSWDNGITNGVSFTATSTTTYTVTVSNANGCTATKPQTITVNPLPTPAITITETSGTADDGTVCAGSGVTLAGVGGTSYGWDNGISDGVAFIPPSTTNYTLTVTDANGCVATKLQTITVSVPAPTITVAETSGTANDGIVCAGSGVTLTGGGGTTYSWDNGVSDGVSFVPSSTTTYTLTVTDANGCTATLAQTITVNSLPTPTITVTETSGTANDGTVCAGTSVTLAGGGGTSYSWDNGISDGVSFLASSTTTYTVTVTDANGCTATKPQTITVNTLPVPTISITETSGTANDGMVCAGSAVTLTAGGGISYTWDHGITNGAGFVPSATTTYTVTVTNASGCSDTRSQVITVRDLPAISTIGTLSPACYNAGAQTSSLAYAATTGSPVSYSINWGSGITDQGNTSFSFQPAGGTIDNILLSAGVSAGTYSGTMTLATADGCTATQAVSETVDPLPSLTGMDLQSPVCEGNSATVSLTGLINDSQSTIEYTINAVTHSIDNVVANGSGGASFASFPLEAADNGNDFIITRVTSETGGGCTKSFSRSHNITVNTLPAPVVTGSTTACANSSGNTYSTAVAMSNYSWSISGGTITSATNIRNIVVTWGAGPTGTLTVTCTKNGCSGTSPAHTVTINSIPVSSVTGPASACLNVPGSIYSIASGMVSYAWSVNPADGIINGSTDGSSASVTWIASGSKTITVNYITPTGCNGSSSKTVQVNALPV
ncbi:MAG TPA: hypothetical protein VK155_18965, partial [Bacteroidales bacterium]|nr:hypothetical protein [Bacteroidales bacterium]